MHQNPPDERIKQAKGKLRLSLVPNALIRAAAHALGYGQMKYNPDGKTPKSWKNIPTSYIIDATYRHFLSVVEDPKSLDDESGLPHLWHCICNMAFLADKLEYTLHEEIKIRREEKYHE